LEGAFSVEAYLDSTKQLEHFGAMDEPGKPRGVEYEFIVEIYPTAVEQRGFDSAYKVL
jgi:hypothetical protein